MNFMTIYFLPIVSSIQSSFSKGYASAFRNLGPNLSFILMKLAYKNKHTCTHICLACEVWYHELKLSKCDISMLWNQSRPSQRPLFYIYQNNLVDNLVYYYLRASEICCHKRSDGRRVAFRRNRSIRFIYGL